MELELLAMLQMDRNLSCNLRQLRLDHQMSVEEMARIMELPPDAVAAIEVGQFPDRLRLSHLDNLSRRFLHLTFPDLLLTLPESW